MDNVEIIINEISYLIFDLARQKNCQCGMIEISFDEKSKNAKFALNTFEKKSKLKVQYTEKLN